MAKTTDKGATDGFRDVSPTLMRFLKEGDTLIGKLIKLDTVKVNSKDCHRAWIETESDGVMVMLMTAQLEPIFSGLAADGSQMVKVVYAGEIKIEDGRKVKEFKVGVKAAQAS